MKFYSKIYSMVCLSSKKSFFFLGDSLTFRILKILKYVRMSTRFDYCHDVDVINM